MADTIKISPQGYQYTKEPTSEHPFWEDESGGTDTPASSANITATASVNDTTGTPAVSVTKTTTDDTTNFDFAFSNLKGEKGEQGEKGETGATGAEGPQGPQGEAGTNGTNGISPTVASTGNTGSGEIAGTITGADGAQITVYNGAKGEQGPAGKDGSDASVDTSSLVKNVSITNENGIYTLSQTKGETTTEIGTIEVPSVNTDNLLAEITDSVVETTSGNYQNDFHTLKETENNGTQNEVGNFYIARNQITGIRNASGANDGLRYRNLIISKINQDGTTSEDTVSAYSDVYASATSAGVVKIGDGLTMTDGVLSVSSSGGTTPTASSINAGSKLTLEEETEYLVSNQDAIEVSQNSTRTIQLVLSIDDVTIGSIFNITFTNTYIYSQTIHFMLLFKVFILSSYLYAFALQYEITSNYGTGTGSGHTITSTAPTIMKQYVTDTTIKAQIQLDSGDSATFPAFNVIKM